MKALESNLVNNFWKQGVTYFINMYSSCYSLLLQQIVAGFCIITPGTGTV